MIGRLDPSIELRRESLGSISQDDLSIEWDVDVDLGVDLPAKEQTIRGQFVRDVLASGELTHQRRQRVLLIGFRALAGSDNLEGAR